MSNQDNVIEFDPKLNEITEKIIGAAIEVHRELGPGYLESIYEAALAVEFDFQNIPFERQKRVPLTYRETPIGEHRLDMVVEGKIVVELKAIDKMAEIHKAQVISYLRATGLRLGLLINFNVPVLKNGVVRVAL